MSKYSKKTINGNEYYVKKINGKPLYGKTVAELERKIKVAETSVKAKKDVSEITLGDYIIDWHESIEGVKINKSAELLGVTVVRANTTKNEYRKRDVQIPSPLAEIVAEKIDEHEKDELIFTNKHGELLSKSGLRKRWNSYLIDMDIFYNDKKKKCDHTKTPEEKVLTIDRFLPYDLRHTYATLLARSNASERNTTALMGHALGSTTDKYYIDFNQLNTAPDVANLAQLIKSITASNKNERTEENES